MGAESLFFIEEKIVKKLIIGVVITIVLALSYFSYLFCKNNYTMIINIAAVVIYSCFLIPYAFCNMLSSLPSSKMSGYYCCLHLLYVILPIALVGNILVVGQALWMVLITQLISIGNLFILYRCCKHLIKKHLKYLRYSNMVISGIFIFLIPLLCLLKDYLMYKCPQMYEGYIYKDSLNVVFTFLFLLPLFGLQVLYEKIGLSNEG